MRTLIIPCAGRSTRYDEDIPKYLLIHPSGNMMVYEAIQGLPLDTFDDIFIIVLRQHMIEDTLYRIKEQFKEYNNFNVHILEKETSSASETVTKCLLDNNIEGEIYLKDSDCSFDVDLVNPNQVCVYSLEKSENITPGTKSYIRKDRNGEILTIIEKKVISSDFSCGLYSFESAKEFVKTFEELSNTISGEIYISHIIYKMILNNKKFTTNEVENFKDWGTQKDWDIFNYFYKNDDKK